MKQIIKRIGMNKYFTFAMLFIACSGVNILYTNHKTATLQRKYVVVDTDAISTEFLARIIKADVPQERYKELLIEYDRTLTSVINKVSETNGFVILKRTAVLTELPNLTQDVKTIVFKEMNERT